MVVCVVGRSLLGLVVGGEDGSQLLEALPHRVDVGDAFKVDLTVGVVVCTHNMGGGGILRLSNLDE